MHLAPALSTRLHPWQRHGWKLMSRALWQAFFAPRHERKAVRVLLEWCRQSGKNELAAIWDACWLVSGAAWMLQGKLDLPPKPGGLAPLWEAVHSAPTYKPGITVAKRRLEAYLGGMIDGQLPWVKEDGQVYRAGAGLPAMLNMVSAGETANRRSLTANAYLRCDEVQSTPPQVYGAELSPMCSSTGAFQVFQGTIWPESLGEQLRPQLLAEQEADGIQRVYQVPWTVVAEHNPAYGAHVQAEIARLGEHHPIIDSEYRLRTPRAAGAFLEPEDLDKLFGGQHTRPERGRPEKAYVAGIDWTGAAMAPDEHALDPEWTQHRDCTCVRIGQLGWRLERAVGSGDTAWTPEVQVVAMLLLPGQQPEESVAKVEQILRAWNVRIAHGERNGVGDGPCAMLEARLPGVFTGVTTSAATVKRQGLRLLGAISSGRFRMWHEPDEKSDEWLETLKQYTHLKRWAGEGGSFKWGHPKRRVAGENIHDDIPKADGLLLDAAYDHLARVQPAVRRVYEPYDEAAGTEG